MKRFTPGTVSVDLSALVSSESLDQISNALMAYEYVRRHANLNLQNSREPEGTNPLATNTVHPKMVRGQVG